MRYLLYSLFIFIGLKGFSATFNSTGANTNWSNAAAWTLVSGSDADNIPDLDDDVVVLTGHTINLTALSEAKTLTINAGSTFNWDYFRMDLYGGLTNSGSINGGIQLYINNATCSIISSTALNFSFSTVRPGMLQIQSSNVTIPSGTSILNNLGTLAVRKGSTLNNNGIILTKTLSSASTSLNTLNNNSGSTFYLYANHTYNSSKLTINNNVNSTFLLMSAVSNVPAVSYGNLTLNGATTKTAVAAVNVTGNLTINSGTLNMNSFTLTVSKNITNLALFSNLNTLTLNGTFNQIISCSNPATIPVLNSTNTGNISLNTTTYNISTSATFAGGASVGIGATLSLGSSTFTTSGAVGNSGTITSTGAGAISIGSDFDNDGTFNSSGTAAVTISGYLDNYSSRTFSVNGNLTLGGDLNNDGTLTTNSNFTFNGVSAQQLNASNNITFFDMTLNNSNGLTINSGSHSITNSLTISAGQLNAGSNLLTLVSDATKTAYIGQSLGTISGSMIIQRNLPARVASWTDMSPQVDGSSIDDWDDELYMSIGAPNNVPGFPGGDGSASGSNSVSIFNEATGVTSAVLTGTALIPGKGYSVFIADDLTSFPGRTIDLRNTPNIGDVSIATTNSGGTYAGYNLVGNPYPSWIDWSAVVGDNATFDPTIYIYDGSGNYVTTTNPTIAPGQGFYCYTSTSGQLDFKETHKTNSTSSAFLKESKDYDLKVRLSNSNSPFYHEIKIITNNSGKSGLKNMLYIPSKEKMAPAITFNVNEEKVVRLNLFENKETVLIPLTIKAPEAGNYIIQLEGILDNDNYSEAYILNNNRKFKLSDDDAFSVYLDQSENITDYSLLLTKKSSTNEIKSTSNSVSSFATSGFLNLTNNFSTSKRALVEIYNTMGQLVKSVNVELNPNALNYISTEMLSSEVYLVRITTDDKQQFSNKLVLFN